MTMKPVLFGLALLAAVTGFGLLPADEATAPALEAPRVITPAPVVPTPEWTVRPIPTDGREDDTP